jgi:hypothetical protein
MAAMPPLMATPAVGGFAVAIQGKRETKQKAKNRAVTKKMTSLFAFLCSIMIFLLFVGENRPRWNTELDSHNFSVRMNCNTIGLICQVWTKKNPAS